MLTGMQNNADCREMKTKKKNRKAKKKGGKDDIWEIGDEMERERIRLFWTNLGEEERRALVKLEKEAVVKKMKEQQKQTCSCSVCGRRRYDLIVILEVISRVSLNCCTIPIIRSWRILRICNWILQTFIGNIHIQQGTHTTITIIIIIITTKKCHHWLMMTKRIMMECQRMRSTQLRVRIRGSWNLEQASR